jgi:5-methylthioribose kinase
VFEITSAGAASYLAARGLPQPRSVTELGGGVSNTVLLIELPERRIVLKQALHKLRVEQDWFSECGRIFRESAALCRLARHLPAGSVPEVLFEDRDNFAFAMTAAPPEAETWKAQLMRGEAHPEIAAAIGELLAAIIRTTWHGSEWETRFGDQTVFDQLRLDPYYRSTARVHPELADRFDSLMRESASHRVALVHGDWSPKNFLVAGGSVMAIDFEVVHFGDPAFDVAFLLNHLALKSFLHRPYKPYYQEAATRFLAPLPSWLESAAMPHFAALMLARVDGKSPVEYLPSGLRDKVRQTARGLILDPAATVQEAFARI